MLSGVGGEEEKMKKTGRRNVGMERIEERMAGKEIQKKIREEERRRKGERKG